MPVNAPRRPLQATNTLSRAHRLLLTLLLALLTRLLAWLDTLERRVPR